MPQKRFIVALSRTERKQLEKTISKGKGAAYRIKTCPYFAGSR
jgi:hypothetical protein